jgi:putative redox protein
MTDQQIANRTQSGDADGDGWVATRVGPTGYRAEIHVRTHALLADEPVAAGGADAGPTPYEYLLAALGACMSMTLRIYADRKGWPLEGVEVRLRTEQSHEADCENCATAAVGMTNIERRIELYGTLTDEQRQRLLQIADRCPVKQTLERGISIKRAS